MFSASELFDLAIQVEMNGERIYRHAAGRVARDSLKEILGWLADQESQHKSAFRKIREKIGKKEKRRSTSAPDHEESMVLRRAMGRHAFSLDEIEAEAFTGEREVLETAISFEEDAIRFFEFIAGFVTDAEALSTIEEIRREELNHKHMLEEKLSEI